MPASPAPTRDSADYEAVDEATGSQGDGGMCCSQMSEPANDDTRCPICLNMWFEPVSTPCRHIFCRPCFYPAVRITRASAPLGSSLPRRVPGCPICKEAIPLEVCHPPIEQSLWAGIQAKYPKYVERRRKLIEAEIARHQAPVGGGVSGGGGPDSAAAAAGMLLTLQRDMLAGEMLRHRAALVAGTSDYFAQLPAELERPHNELRRCNCQPVRFVSVRKVSRRPGTNCGRGFWSCPLGRGAPGSCAFFVWE